MIFQLTYKMSNHWWCLTVATTNTNDGIQSNTTVHALHWIHFWWCNTVIAIIMNQIFPFHIKKQTCARGCCMIEKCYFLSEALQNSGKNTKYFHIIKQKKLHIKGTHKLKTTQIDFTQNPHCKYRKYPKFAYPKYIHGKVHP